MNDKTTLCEHFFIYNRDRRIDQCYKCKLNLRDYLLFLKSKTTKEGDIDIHLHSWILKSNIDGTPSNTWKCRMYFCDKEISFL